MLEEWGADFDADSTELDELVSEFAAQYPEFEPTPAPVVISNFSLTNGQYAAQTTGEEPIQAFFQELQLDSVYMPESGWYAISGTKAIELTETIDDATYVDKCNGEFAGEYDPVTGQFSGTFTYYQSYDIKSSAIKMKGWLFDLTGEFTGTVSPMDKTVSLSFHGINKTEIGTNIETTLLVTFDVIGDIPFAQ